MRLVADERFHSPARAWILGALAMALLGAFATLGPKPSTAQSTSETPPLVQGSCTPLDLAFVVDDSGSMGPAIMNVKSGLNNIISDAVVVGANNLQMGVIGFERDVQVLTRFSLNNVDQARAGVNTLQGTSQPGNAEPPETGDEALKTAILALRAADRPAGPVPPSPGKPNTQARPAAHQIGDFTPGFRPEAEKIIIYITDALPAGFDDNYVPGVDDVNLRGVAQEAANRGIRINSIYIDDADGHPAEVPLMQEVASITGGTYAEGGSTGSGTTAAIQAAVRTCGRPPQKCKGKFATRRASDVRDVITGTRKRDVIAAGAGNDRIKGKGGNDLLCGGKGKDKLIGGKGKDKLIGEGGKDKLSGGGKKDRLKGGKGKDRLKGNGGKDKLSGGKGKDTLKGGAKKDKLSGGPGKDVEIQ